MPSQFDELKTALADRYLLDHELGAGGIATVFLAHAIGHNRKVAIKVLRPDLAAMIGADRFLREIETTANLQHPHILPLFDSGRVESTVFYVMPYVQGGSLRTRLKRETQLPVPDAIRIATEIANALDYAHRQGVIHRDIKPDNVLFHDGRVMVADFGLALSWSQGDDGHRLTNPGIGLGTPYYMSPEQAAGKLDLDPRTDVFSLGVVMYEMLAGRHPFTGPSIQEIFQAILSNEAAPAINSRKTVPNHVAATVARALEKLPADRWQSAAQFADALAGRIPAGDVGSRALPAAWSRSAIPWALSTVLLLILAWVGIPTGARPPASPSVGPMRFETELDPGVELTFTPIVKLSPDGKNLFMTAIVNRREEVIHRSFDETRMEVIHGAGQGDQGTGNSRPFVSPDGRWVAYAKQGKLRKVPVQGGPAIDLADCDWAGGSWGRNGKLVYSPSYNTGLWIVSEEGGDARMLTAPDTTKGELGHWWPQILPDGDHVIFTAYRIPTDRATVEVLSIKTGKRKVLLTGGVFGLYVSSGHLLYAAGEAIRAVPFDLDRLEVKGASIPVVDSVAMNSTDGGEAFDVSEKGNLAYLAALSYITPTDLVLVDRRGHEVRALPQS